MTTISDRISALQSKIQSIATAHATASVPADDVFQTIAIKMIERAAKDKTFASQKDAYLLNFAKWTAKDARGAASTYIRYVDEEGFVTGDADGEDEEVSTFETIDFADCMTPEQAVIEAEADEEIAAVVASLPVKYQAVVKMLYVGYSKSEIADALKVSRPMVTKMLNKIETVLTGASL